MRFRHIVGFTLIVLVGLTLLRAPVSAQRSGQRQATLTAAIESREIVVRVRNNRSVDLEAWTFEIAFQNLANQPVHDESTIDTYLALAGPPRAGAGPIAPNETREIRIPASDAQVVTGATLKAALYSDMSYDGLPVGKDRILARREENGSELAIWIQALDEIRTKPAAVAKSVLQNKMRERVAASAMRPRESFGKDLQQTVEQLLRASDESPMTVGPLTAQIRSLFARQRDLALRHRNSAAVGGR